MRTMNKASEQSSQDFTLTWHLVLCTSGTQVEYELKRLVTKLFLSPAPFNLTKATPFAK